jgi:nucleoside-diphosphate-sugar epimerase
MQILIIGCGYLGERAARAWLEQGHQVCALTRNPAHAVKCREMGIDAVVGDVLNPASLRALPAADLCLYAVGYDRSGTASKRDVSVNGLQNVLQEIAGRIPRLIFISSTSVYGQDHGEIVNEDSPCEPVAEGGKICLEAEARVQAVWRGDARSAVILRLAGIYGPRRLIGRIDQLQRQEPLTGNPDAWLNLIHVDDAVQAVLRIAQFDPGWRTWLLSDARPLHRHEFYAALARAAGVPPPVFSQSGETGLNKRCDSSRILSDVDLRLMFPSAIDALPLLIEA